MRTCNPRTACLMHWAAGNRGRFRHSRSPRRPPVLLMTVVAAFLVLKDAGVEARERAWLPPMVARVDLHCLGMRVRWAGRRLLLLTRFPALHRTTPSPAQGSSTALYPTRNCASFAAVSAMLSCASNCCVQVLGPVRDGEFVMRGDGRCGVGAGNG